MRQHQEYVFNFFFEMHICLNSEWLEGALDFLASRPDVKRMYPTPQKTAHLIFEQWLNSDLVHSTAPSLQFLENKPNKLIVMDPLIIQIVSIIDVGRPLLAQFNKLTYEFIDNSGFEAPKEDDEKGENRFEAKPRRCLLMTVSDGVTELKAMEYQSVRTLSLFTSPGSKLILKPPITCRRGMFMLTEANCQCLGGDVEELFKTGRPVAVMAKMLKKEIPVSRKMKPLTTRGVEQRQTNAPASQRAPAPVAYESSEPPPIPDDFDEEMIFEDVVSTTSPPRRPIAQVPPVLSGRETDPAPPRPPTVTRIPLNGTCFSATPSVQQERRPSSGTYNGSVQKKSRYDDSPSTSFASSASSSIRTPRPSLDSTQILDETPPKRPPRKQFDRSMVKVEVIDIDDSPPVDLSTATPSRLPPVTPMRTTVTAVQEPEDEYVRRYRDLKVITIADALRQLKWVAGSMRKTVAAVLQNIVEPIRVVDELWTAKINLRDHTKSDLTVIIDNTVLEELIGMTATEAMAVRASSDASRRSEGGVRLRAAKAAMHRLDLLWEIQFVQKVTPVVRKMSTLPQALGYCPE